MLSMLRSNLFRLVKTRFTWVFLLVYVLIVFLGPLTTLFIASNTQSVPDAAFALSPSITAAQMYGGAFTSGAIAPIVASMFLANFFSADFKTKAIKNVLQAHGGRISYSLAAAGTILVVVAAMMVATVVTAEIAYRSLGFAVVDYGFAELAPMLLQVFLVLAAYSAIAVFLACATGRETFATMGALVVSGGLVESIARMVLANVFSEFPPLRDCLDGYLGAQMIALSQGVVSEAGGFAAAAATFAVFVGLCVFVMKRRDLAK